MISSLVYLAGQVRTSGRQSRQAAIHSVVAKIQGVWHMLREGDTADLWVRGSKGLAHLETEAQRVQLSALFFAVMQPYEELYHYRAYARMGSWVNN